jgi:hypothetical protein
MKSDGINPGGTHFPILAAAVARTKGLVVECGVGDYSTPLLHFMCAQEQRVLISYETSAEWLELFSQYRAPWHAMVALKDWQDCWGFGGDESEIGVAFIDCAPGNMRPFLAERFSQRAHYIVCHDLEAYGDGWPSIEGVFKYTTIWKQYPTWTGVFSNFEEFKL